jgi:hypothetical protein
VSRLHHVALLVASLEELLPALSARGWAAEPIQSFPKEGTRETYVAKAGLAPAAGRPAPCGRLLLVQPVGPGPYARALAERGPGLHHLGLAVSDLSAFAAALPASGWFVHPFSLRGGARLGDLWLFRPGFPALVEVFEGAADERPAALIQAVKLPLAGGLQPLLDSLGCAALQPAAGQFAVLQTPDGPVPVGELLKSRQAAGTPPG